MPSSTRALYQNIGSINNHLASKKKEKKVRLLTKNKKPRRGAKSIYVGIEVEFYAPSEKMKNIEELLVKYNLSGYVTLQQDGSIHPPQMNCDNCPVRDCEQDEFCSYKPAEITIIASEQKYKRIMERVDNVFRELGAEVNESCGLHVHLDMRHRDPKKVFHNLSKSQGLLYEMCPYSRKTNTYCKEMPLTDLERARREYDRYYGVNPQAVSKYKTVECRIHSGTIEFQKIFNWITLLLKIADHDTLQEFPENLSKIKELLILPDPLLNYIKERITKFYPDSPFLNS